MRINRLCAAGWAAAAFATLLSVAAPLAAHGLDPLERAPTAPARNAGVEHIVGELREVLVNDRVANASVRYRWVSLADGSAVMVRGTATDALAAGSTVEVTGRRNGNSLFATHARPVDVRGNRKAAGTATKPTRLEGELRMVHVDFDEQSKSRFEYEVVDAAGNVVPLALDVRPEALQGGMRVIVHGRMADGKLAPDSIEITAMPRASVSKVTEKATVTNNVLVILIRFADSGPQPFTQAQVQATFAGGTGSGSVAEYFREVSYGQQLLNATVTPWLSSSSLTPANCDWRAMGTLARNAATAAGYTTAAYQNLVYVFPQVSGCGWSGLAYVGGSGVWSNGRNTLLVYAHELGHNFGLLHAGSVDCGAAALGGTCSVSEYGDPFDVMGNQRAMHFNSTQKSLLGWIGASRVATHTSGTATYTLSPLETSGGAAYAVKVQVAPNRTYWLEYRQPIGFDAPLASYPSNGVQVRLATPFETICGSCDAFSNDTQIVDMSPATTTFTDAALLVGQGYTDSKYGVTFNVLSASSTGVSVQVTGPGSSPTPTTTSLASSLNPSTVGTSVTFTATVTGISPTGTVQFTANGTTISGCSAVALAGSGDTRTAACSTGALSAGSHGIAARYGGDAANMVSSSPTLTQTVNALPTTASTNVALAANGATASASSSTSASYPASATINGERAGANWGAGGGWRDGTYNAWPDWVQVNFSGSKTIDRVVVYSLQDNYRYPVEPTSTMTFSAYGLRDFTVQGWNGSTWVTLATVTGNTLVKRTVTFTPFSTDRIRINVTHGLSNHSRITEIEAWGTAVAASSNVALAANGATASASSSTSASYPASATINGERAGINWGAGGGWRDGTAGAWPDWVQVNFSGSKTVAQVVVYSVQDDYASPVEPTSTMTFSAYGLRDFTVQGWNGSSWVTLATVSGNTLVKRTVSFSAFTTDRIRIHVTNGLSNYSRITEIEAWGF